MLKKRSAGLPPQKDRKVERTINKNEMELPIIILFRYLMVK